jgi:hypothetical protein
LSDIGQSQASSRFATGRANATEVPLSTMMVERSKRYGIPFFVLLSQSLHSKRVSFGGGCRKRLKTNKLNRKVVKNKDLVMDLSGLHRFQGRLFQIVGRRSKIAREPKLLSPGPPEP